jgi:triosephosphate isomerase
MRRPVIVGNWKMYKTIGETRKFMEEFWELVRSSTHCDIVIAPPFTAILEAVKAAEGTSIAISAQDVFWEKEGAYTGEISASMLVDLGCRYTIIGHSERRQYFGENNETVNKKIRAALSANLIPIVCVGETQAQREARRTQKVIQAQHRKGFSGLTDKDFSNIIVAYEPVWAIGTGNTATPDLAQEAHQFIRHVAEKEHGAVVAQELRILYGGSVKPDNIKALMAQADIDGALVGGASLKADSFASIVSF